MTTLINHKPKRLFAFGCSFTKYFWTTWPEIVADALDVPFYNFGRSGAGNQYMANVLMQAHKTHKIDKDDLVIISWTNVCREDRWAKGDWLLTGNIFSQGIYNEEFVTKFADPVGYYVRDLATISMVSELLESIGCQYKFLSMCNIIERQDQGEEHNLIEDRYKHTFNHITNLYKDSTDKILPSFYDILWHNDIHRYKFDIEKQILSPFFLDGHPSPIEHYKYMISMFEYPWSAELASKVSAAQENYVKIIKELANTYKKPFAIYDQPKEILNSLREKTLIKQSMPVKHV